MILDHAGMTISHEGVVWAPPRREWTLIAAMSAQPGRVWDRDTLMRISGTWSEDVWVVATWIKRIRKGIRMIGWDDRKNPVITTRYGIGYAWTLPVTLAPADHAPAAGADEFRFKTGMKDAGR